jgi:hypothetical protein
MVPAANIFDGRGIREALYLEDRMTGGIQAVTGYRPPRELSSGKYI